MLLSFLGQSCSKLHFIVGLLQLLTFTPYYVGLIWSIAWGILIFFQFSSQNTVGNEKLNQEQPQFNMSKNQKFMKGRPNI